MVVVVVVESSCRGCKGVGAGSRAWSSVLCDLLWLLDFFDVNLGWDGRTAPGLSV